MYSDSLAWLFINMKIGFRKEINFCTLYEQLQRKITEN
jgi:hypothetical protein